MKNELQIKILDIELQNLYFNKIESNPGFEKNTDVSFNIKGDVIEFLCRFDLKMSEVEIKSEYLYTIEIENPKDIALEEFIEKEKFEIVFPVLNRMSGLLAKITDEISTFPFVVPSHFWMNEEDE